MRNVLVAVAIGTAFVYSVAASFWIEGEVFCEAAAFLATFVLLGRSAVSVPPGTLSV